MLKDTKKLRSPCHSTRYGKMILETPKGNAMPITNYVMLACLPVIMIISHAVLMSTTGNPAVAVLGSILAALGAYRINSASPYFVTTVIAGLILSALLQMVIPEPAVVVAFVFWVWITLMTGVAKFVAGDKHLTWLPLGRVTLLAAYVATVSGGLTATGDHWPEIHGYVAIFVGSLVSIFLVRTLEEDVGEGMSHL